MSINKLLKIFTSVPNANLIEISFILGWFCKYFAYGLKKACDIPVRV